MTVFHRVHDQVEIPPIIMPSCSPISSISLIKSRKNCGSSLLGAYKLHTMSSWSAILIFKSIRLPFVSFLTFSISIIFQSKQKSTRFKSLSLELFDASVNLNLLFLINIYSVPYPHLKLYILLNSCIKERY